MAGTWTTPIYFRTPPPSGPIMPNAEDAFLVVFNGLP